MIDPVVWGEDLLAERMEGHSLGEGGKEEMKLDLVSPSMGNNVRYRTWWGVFLTLSLFNVEEGGFLHLLLF